MESLLVHAVLCICKCCMHTSPQVNEPAPSLRNVAWVAPMLAKLGTLGVTKLQFHGLPASWDCFNELVLSMTGSLCLVCCWRRYKKVRESVTAEEAPADLPDDLKHLLQVRCSGTPADVKAAMT